MRERPGPPIEKKAPAPIKKSLDWVTCPKHGTPYPKDGQCPLCAVEQEKR